MGGSGRVCFVLAEALVSFSWALVVGSVSRLTHFAMCGLVFTHERSFPATRGATLTYDSRRPLGLDTSCVRKEGETEKLPLTLRGVLL